jgi:predicted hotdog family 3-hydroxylacyl-ACP dehydratase
MSASSPPPATLDHAGIAARIPHQGRMCLLDRLLHWSSREIRCSAISHRDPDHPLRGMAGLPAACAIEYAAQAMALHGALQAPGTPASSGFLASARQVRLLVPRLDNIAGALRVQAELLAGDPRQALYRFTLSDEAGQVLVDGRATVVLDTPLRS